MKLLQSDEVTKATLELGSEVARVTFTNGIEGGRRHRVVGMPRGARAPFKGRRASVIDASPL
jgi:hypothetical protein